DFTDYLSVFFWLCLVCFGGLHVVLNLWPGHATVGGNRLPSDGSQLLRVWTARRHRRANRARYLAAVEADKLVAAGNFADALRAVQKLQAETPDNFHWSRVIMAIHTQRGAHDEALAIGRERLNQPGLSDPQKAELLDSMACVAIYHARPDLLNQAEAWANLALRCSPNALTLKGTLGGVLVDLGRVDEGLPLLREVLAKSECEIDQVICLAYLAMIAQREKNLPEAKRLLGQAQAIQPDQAIVKRAAKMQAEG
ncbi:MAG: hypothetical protein JWQ83_1423, partial [Lacunisphaera sp.]|nr:hypothetical protein [Lacunisphaera sp.]